MPALNLQIIAKFPDTTEGSLLCIAPAPHYATVQCILHSTVYSAQYSVFCHTQASMEHVGGF